VATGNDRVLNSHTRSVEGVRGCWPAARHFEVVGHLGNGFRCWRSLRLVLDTWPLALQRTGIQKEDSMARMHDRFPLDLDTIRQSFGNCDLGLLDTLYTDDATMKVIDNTRPPSSPMEMRGKSEISGYFRDICGRKTTHNIGEEVLGDQRISFFDFCRYDDGTRVVASNVLDFENGKIKRHTIVQAWDETTH
jgi:hypothetical protein